MKMPSTMATAMPSAPPASGWVDDPVALAAALTPDRQRGQEREAPSATADRFVHASLEFALHPPGRAGHEEDHPGHEADGDDRQRATDRLLGLEAQAIR